MPETVLLRVEIFGLLFSPLLMLAVLAGLRRTEQGRVPVRMRDDVTRTANGKLYGAGNTTA